MKLRLKILSGFMILVATLFVAGVWSMYQLTTIGASVQGILDDNYRSINASKKMIEALEREDSAVLLLLSGEWKEGREILKSAHKAFQQGYETVRGNITIAGEEEQVSRIEAAYNTYKDLWERPIVATDRESNLAWYFQEIHPAFQEVKLTVETLMAMNDKTMYQTATSLKDRAHRAAMPGIVAIVAALVFTLVFNYFVNYYVVNPILRLTEGIQKHVQTGEPLDVVIETQDELLDLKSAIQNLLTKRHKEEAQ
ncbi:MAG: MCP four helix bundle domain-containing protein [Deltaproteobacteria bacterium]|nr:MCP four helix bundle domain-containing protein [Deltaproteobacteria bacterium]